MPDIFKSLQRLSWRGIELPITSRRCERAHDVVRHPLVYSNGELLEDTGSKNWIFTYTIPFRESIASGPYKQLYTRVLIEKFIPAYADCTRGPLIDPAYGPFTCKPISYVSETDVDKRDGEDITVVFEEAPEQDKESELTSTLSNTWAASEAGALDEAIIAIPQAPELDLPKLKNPLDAIAGVLSQARNYVDQIAATMDDVSSRCERIESEIDKLEDVRNSPIVRSVKRLHRNVERIKERASNPLGSIVAFVASVDTTLSVVAGKHGMSLQQLLDINPHAPMLVKAGTSVRVISGGGQ